jgi:L-asparaginase
MTIEAVVTKVMWLLAQNCENFDQLQQRFYRQINFDTFYH